ncbi:hypothetical protein RN001_006721 [Aquatica leii]|uniref:Peptidase S1 domain-containing protein n=1 Tax=Aquatica leii TaxID=1421715 RepID=A0AAN7Q5Z6_9COLE|nr:hypothetical protein RN001_006721 [Aquatica leii]
MSSLWVIQQPRGSKPLQRKLKKNVVPSLFPHEEETHNETGIQKTPTQVCYSNRAKKRLLFEDLLEQQVTEIAVQNEADTITGGMAIDATVPHTCQTVHCQTMKTSMLNVHSFVEYPRDRAQRIMNEECSSDDGGNSGDSLDEYQPSESEHYTSSDEKEPCVLGRNLDGDRNDHLDTEGPCSNKIKKTPMDFNWNFDEEFSPKIFNFDTTKSGVTDNNLFNERSSELDFLIQFFMKLYFNMLVEFTLFVLFFVRCVYCQLPPGYVCVPAGTCPSTAGTVIDVRIVTPVRGTNPCPPGQVPCPTTTPGNICGRRNVTNISPFDGFATQGAWPWQAYLVNQTGYAGSGALITPNTVLTAAHKVVGNRATPGMIGVYMGVYSPSQLGTRLSVMIVSIHPAFNIQTFFNDIAILTLTASIAPLPQTLINTVCLPTAGQSFLGQICSVSGWGQTTFALNDAPIMQQKQVNVTIVNYSTCYASMSSPSLLGLNVNTYLDPVGEICAGGEAFRDACTQDGGSPLVCFVNNVFVVAGLVIWGNPCPPGQVPCLIQTTTSTTTTTTSTTPRPTTPNPATFCGKRAVSNVSPFDGFATQGAWPWQAYLMNQTGFAGSGALLTANAIVTAAHKVYGNRANPQLIGVYMGVYNPNSLGTRLGVSSVIIHPQFSLANYFNDIALIILTNPINVLPQTLINTICYPPAGLSFVGRTCSVSGWGQTNFNSNDAPLLQQKQVNVTIVSYTTCYASMSNPLVLGSNANVFLDPQGEICAGGEPSRDSCTHDGGGPLVCFVNGVFVLVGLVIWGVGCGDGGVYGVYVNVPYYTSWIQATLSSLVSVMAHPINQRTLKIFTLLAKEQKEEESPAQTETSVQTLLLLDIPEVTDTLNTNEFNAGFIENCNIIEEEQSDENDINDSDYNPDMSEIDYQSEAEKQEDELKNTHGGSETQIMQVDGMEVGQNIGDGIKMKQVKDDKEEEAQCDGHKKEKRQRRHLVNENVWKKKHQ